jgi:anti-anti-sigma factor
VGTRFGNQAAVAVVSRPGNAFSCVRVTGDIDIIAEPGLADAAEQLRAAAPCAVLIDLAGVTFACSTLANFVVRVHNAIPDSASLVLCRPTPQTRHLLDLTDLHLIATFCDHLPPQWDASHAATSGGHPPGWSRTRRSHHTH